MSTEHPLIEITYTVPGNGGGIVVPSKAHITVRGDNTITVINNLKTLISEIESIGARKASDDDK